MVLWQGETQWNHLFLLVEVWRRVGKALVDLCHSKQQFHCSHSLCKPPGPVSVGLCQMLCPSLSLPRALASCFMSQPKPKKTKACGRREVPERQHKAEEHSGHSSVQLSPLALSFSFYFDKTLFVPHSPLINTKMLFWDLPTVTFLSSFSFNWTKDGKPFDLSSDPRIITTNNSGTFVIQNRGIINNFQGKYRCFASNVLGTAMSEEIELIVPSKGFIFGLNL